MPFRPGGISNGMFSVSAPVCAFTWGATVCTEKTLGDVSVGGFPPPEGESGPERDAGEEADVVFGEAAIPELVELEELALVVVDDAGLVLEVCAKASEKGERLSASMRAIERS